MMYWIKKLWKDDSGVTAVEYGLITGVMAALIFVIFGMFGDHLKTLFVSITDRLGEATDQVANR